MTRSLLVVATLAAGSCTALVDIDRSRLDTEPPCDSDDQCDDGYYCNGAERCVARSCVTGDDPCTDHIGCTVDFCDEETYECTYEGRDERCSQKPVRQECIVGEGCQPIVGDG